MNKPWRSHKDPIGDRLPYWKEGGTEVFFDLRSGAWHVNGDSAKRVTLPYDRLLDGFADDPRLRGLAALRTDPQKTATGVL